MRKYLYALNQIQSFHGKKLNQLLEFFGSPRELWEARENELRKLEIVTERNIDEFLFVKNRFIYDKEIERLYSLGVRFSTIDDDDYPERLRTIFDPPPVLYIKGSIPNSPLNIAIVGARKSSHYGKMMAEKIACELGEQGITVISGMARGIDSCAHKGTLNGQGSTIAVLGCGINIVYPRENRNLMDEIVNNGAVITEYPLGAEPLPWRFPARNRIISGLSEGVLVVEAATNSGSLITVDYALEQGRDVFAIPGNVNNPQSKGPNNLIKQGAKLVETANDIIDEYNVLGFNIEKSSNNNEQLEISFSDSEEEKVYNSINSEMIHIDELAVKLKVAINQLLVILINLELKGLINQLPGQYYVRAI